MASEPAENIDTPTVVSDAPISETARVHDDSSQHTMRVRKRNGTTEPVES